MSDFPDFVTARSKVWVTTYVPVGWTGERKVGQLYNVYFTGSSTTGNLAIRK